MRVVRKSEKQGYRGIEYTITIGRFPQRKWVWTFYPRKEEGLLRRGRVVGTREEAEAAF